MMMLGHPAEENQMVWYGTTTTTIPPTTQKRFWLSKLTLDCLSIVLSFNGMGCQRLLLVLLQASCIHAGLNLNFRSQQLSNLLGAQQSSQQSPQPSVQTKKESPDFLRLDLSGRLQILLAGHETTTTTPTTNRIIRPLLPLRESEKSSPYLPDQVNLSVDYDFAQCSWGVLRIVPSYIWKLGRPYHRPYQDDDDSADEPALEIAIEKNLASGIPSAVEGRYLNQQGCLLRARCENTGLVSLSCWLPLHSRLSYQGTLARHVWGSQPHQASTSRLPNETNLQQEDWWLPDLSLSALGTLQAQKQVWVTPPSRQATETTNNNRRVGFRISVRRQLDWSMLQQQNTAAPHDGKTRVRLQVEGAAPDWRVGALLESTLEAPVQDSHTTLSTQWFI